MTEPHLPVETGVDDIAAHPRHTGHRWVDMVLAFSAITISIISLFVAIEHGRTEEKLVAASSWPFVVYDVSTSGLTEGSRTITLSVANSGVGPARIQSARVLLDGKPVHNRGELLARCCGFAGGDVAAQIRDGLRSQNPIIGVLTARDATEVLSIQQTPTNTAQWKRLDAIHPRLSLFACYCSVLDDCWTTDLHSTTYPHPVPRCTPGPDDYTE
jgi:hypothetical protein